MGVNRVSSQRVPEGKGMASSRISDLPLSKMPSTTSAWWRAVSAGNKSVWHRPSSSSGAHPHNAAAAELTYWTLEPLPKINIASGEDSASVR